MPCSLHIGRCVAALLLPLLMRTANQAEIISIFFVVAAAWLLAQSGRKSLYRNFIIPIFAVTSWSYLAAHIADFVVVGEFRRLLLTYAIAFDGMSDMLPEWVAPDIKHQLEDACSSRDIQRPLAFLPPLVEILLVMGGFLPSSDSQVSTQKLLICRIMIFLVTIFPFRRTLAGMERSGRTCDSATGNCFPIHPRHIFGGTSFGLNLSRFKIKFYCSFYELDEWEPEWYEPDINDPDAGRFLDEQGSNMENELKNEVKNKDLVTAGGVVTIPTIVVTDRGPTGCYSGPRKPVEKPPGTCGLTNRCSPKFDTTMLYPRDPREEARVARRKERARKRAEEAKTEKAQKTEEVQKTSKQQRRKSVVVIVRPVDPNNNKCSPRQTK